MSMSAYSMDPGSRHPRQPLCKLSDSELLRQGIVAKHICDSAVRDSADRESLRIQFEEYRKEWKRRKPTLPLSDSLG
jgi:hypothetical protein